MSEYITILTVLLITVTLPFIWLGLNGVWFKLFPRENDEYGDGSVVANLMSFGSMTFLVLLYFYIMNLLGAI